MKPRTLLLGAIAIAAVGWLLWGARATDRAAPRANREVSEGASGAADAVEEDAAPASLPAPTDFEAVDRDRDLHGIVVRRADGLPIAGADLRVVTYPWRRASVLHHDGYYEVVEGIGTRSASDGTFSLRLRPGSGVALRVRAEGYAPLELGARQAGERVRVEMDLGVRLTIVTRDERGGPVPGTRLRLFRGAALDVRGVTDERGRASLGTVPCPAVYTVDVVPARLGYHGWENLQLTEPGEDEHVITLVEGRTITGRVIDAETGAAVSNARIGMNWVMEPSAVSGPDGRYALPGWLGKGMDDIHCVADAYGRAQWVVNGDVHDFELLRGDSVTGRLLGKDGGPVAGAVVSTVGSVDANREQQICTRGGLSDREGRFLLSGLRRDMPHTLIAMAEGHGRYLVDFDPHPEKAGTIDLGDLALPEARTIAGRVLSHAREPVTRTLVYLKGSNADRARLRGGAALNPHSFYGTAEDRYTDDLGRFRFPDLSPGSYELSVRRSGSDGAKLPVALGAEKDLLDVEVVMPDGRDFTVTVVDEEGAPVPMVFVSVLSQGGSSGYNAQTDVAGRATFFVAGKVTKVTAHPFASGRDVLNADVPVEGDPDDFRLVLRKKATIQGTVLGEDGQPLGECWIAAKRDGKNIATARPAADGTFSLDVPQDESFDVEFMGVATARGAIEQEAFAADPVRARSGATGVQLRVRRLEADRTLRVRVVFPDGTPAAGVPVFAGLATGNTGDDGVAELKSLVAREISVRASLPRGRTDVLWPLPTKVVPAGQEVTLKLRKTVAITGVVLLPDGTAAAGAIVQVPGIAGVATDAEGRFTVRVPADEPGPWTLVAEIRDKKLSGEVGEVRTGAAGVQIVLR